MSHLISSKQWHKDTILAYCETIYRLKHTHLTPQRTGNVLLAFFEPSTRTRLSFNAAALDIGASILGFSSAKETSHAKGESFADTVQMLSGYADVIVLRHPENEAAKRAAMQATVPVINAGDGSNEHPTQAMIDMYTIWETFGDIDGLHIGIVGDLLHARTIHSLVYMLCQFSVSLHILNSEHNTFSLSDWEYIRRHGVDVQSHDTLEELIPMLDVCYITRVQTERYDTPSSATLIIPTVSPGLLNQAKSTCIVLHPLPRQMELDTAVDTTRHAAYFEQAKNGRWVRQAILLSALEYGY